MRKEFAMTIDQLILSYELAKSNAAQSGTLEDRNIYSDLVSYYEKCIGEIRSKAGRYLTGTEIARLSGVVI